MSPPPRAAAGRLGSIDGNGNTVVSTPAWTELLQARMML